jgi:hypothetical protein
MLEQDYLMRMFIAFAAALREALAGHAHHDNQLARHQLESTIGLAADMDPDVLLALAPESVATVLSLGSLDDNVAEYIVHALMLESNYLAEDGYDAKSALRKRQANAVAQAFSITYDPSRLEALLNPLGAEDEEAQYGIDADGAS